MILALGVALLIGSTLTIIVGWIIAGSRDKAARRDAETEADTIRMLDETIAIVRDIGRQP